MGKIGYDLIGDVHGFATKLRDLLVKMGYTLTKEKPFYHHPEGRIAVFVGDYIDRGEEEEGVINIVRPMVEGKSALAVMGNHEYNAICYSIKLESGQYMRQHNSRNKKQHKAFIDEFPFGSEKHRDVISWFKTLPIFLELEGLNVIHAAWIKEDIDFLKQHLSENNTLTDEFMVEVAKKGDIYHSMERILKGVEMILPNEQYWLDKDGVSRNTMRFNWFEYKDNVTYRNCALSIPDHVDLPDLEIIDSPILYNSDIPVFFGHYWMRGKPRLQTKKVACLDYSVAKGGELVAYRWNGEENLTEDNFIY